MNSSCFHWVPQLPQFFLYVFCGFVYGHAAESLSKTKDDMVLLFPACQEITVIIKDVFLLFILRDNYRVSLIISVWMIFCAKKKKSPLSALL